MSFWHENFDVANTIGNLVKHLILRIFGAKIQITFLI